MYQKPEMSVSDKDKEEKVSWAGFGRNEICFQASLRIMIITSRRESFYLLTVLIATV